MGHARRKSDSSQPELAAGVGDWDGKGRGIYCIDNEY
jgi:hypothetical protein